MANIITFSNALVTQPDANTIVVTGPDLTTGIWKSNKEVVTDIVFNKRNNTVTVTKEILIFQRNPEPYSWI